MTGVLVAADDTTATVRSLDEPTERTVRYDQIDRAKTVFEWAASPKPGSGAKKQKKKEHSS